MVTRWGFCKCIRGSGGTKLTAVMDILVTTNQVCWPGQVQWWPAQLSRVISTPATCYSQQCRTLVMVLKCYLNPSSGSVIVNDFNTSHKVDTEREPPPKYFRFKKVALTRCQWEGDGRGLAGIRKQQLCVVITIITANCDGLSLSAPCPVSAMETVAQNQDYIETRSQFGQTLH